MEFIGGGFSWQYDRPYGVDHWQNECRSLLYFFKSSLIVEIDGEKSKANYGDIIFIPDGVPHKIWHTSEYYVLDWLHFTLDEQDVIKMNELGVPFSQVVCIDNPSLLSNMILNCCYIYDQNKNHKDITVSHLLKATIFTAASLMLNKDYRNPLKEKYPEIVQLHTAIYHKPELDWTIKKMCEYTNYSSSTIQKVYKQIYDIGCKEDVVESRIRYARFLLSTTTIEIKDIFLKCGFNSYEHFSRTFKKTTGYTPLKFREAYYRSSN